MLILIPAVAAVDVDVGPGHTYSTISAGINAANSGDNINVYDDFGSPLTYTENVLMTKTNLKLTGMGAVTIQGMDIGPDTESFVVSMSTNSVLSNFNIKGVDEYGVFLNDNCVVQNNNISGNWIGVRGPMATNVTIKNNVITDNDEGIYLDSGDVGLIYGNTIKNNNNGINSQTMNHLTIKNNIIKDNQNVAIHSDGCQYGSILQNQITNNGAGIHIVSAIDLPVHFNFIAGNTQYGLQNEKYSFVPNPPYNGIVNAQNNCWGYNDLAGVQSQIENIGNGIVNFTPWIVLSIKASPSIVTLNGTSTITADLQHDSNGGYHTPSKGMVPYTGYAKFLTTKGTISDVKFSNGIATSTLTGLNTLGTAKVTSKVNNQQVTTNVVVAYPAVSIKQILTAASTVKDYYDLHKTLPSTISVGNNKLNMAEFLYLTVTATKNINLNNLNQISPIAVNKPSNPSGKYNPGNLYKSAYLSVATKIKSYITTYGKAPNYANTALGNIPFSKLVYMYSKVLSYYAKNKQLPNYVSI
jgi:parallel beta-helix repeat protein